MLGAIAGDIIGSRFERRNTKNYQFDLFTDECRITDDTVMSIAIADGLLSKVNFRVSMQYWGQKYSEAGYGKSFAKWLISRDPQPYGSWGNGAAMRVSSIGWMGNDLIQVLDLAEKSAAVSHDHKEGIKGAQAIASAIYLARTKKSKKEIKMAMLKHYGYDLSSTVKEIAKDYTFDVSCQGSVPPAIVAFLESTDFESAIRNAIIIGGDSDTIACMAGGIAEAFYGIPNTILDEVLKRIPKDLMCVVDAFTKIENYKSTVINEPPETSENPE